MFLFLEDQMDRKFGINTSNDPRESNKRWMKNAWSGAKNPYDYTVAMTGAILFSIANVINDLTHIPKKRHGLKLSGNFFGR
jgi:hypothetical protein